MNQKQKKRAAQKQKKAAKGIDTSALKLGEVHLSDIRSAQKLWSIFPHDANAVDPVMKYVGGIEALSNMILSWKWLQTIDGGLCAANISAAPSEQFTSDLATHFVEEAS